MSGFQFSAIINNSEMNIFSLTHWLQQGDNENAEENKREPKFKKLRNEKGDIDQYYTSIRKNKEIYEQLNLNKFNNLKEMEVSRKMQSTSCMLWPKRDRETGVPTYETETDSQT